MPRQCNLQRIAHGFMPGNGFVYDILGPVHDALGQLGNCLGQQFGQVRSAGAHGNVVLKLHLAGTLQRTQNHVGVLHKVAVHRHGVTA